MLILNIPIEDLVPEISEDPLNITRLRNVGIDYATNTIDAILDEKYYISIFYFKDYDIKLCNRWVDYTISWGEAGIVIKFKTTRDYSDRITHKEELTH